LQNFETVNQGHETPGRCRPLVNPPSITIDVGDVGDVGSTERCRTRWRTTSLQRTSSFASLTSLQRTQPVGSLASLQRTSLASLTSLQRTQPVGSLGSHQSVASPFAKPVASAPPAWRSSTQRHHGSCWSHRKASGSVALGFVHIA